MKFGGSIQHRRECSYSPYMSMENRVNVFFMHPDIVDLDSDLEYWYGIAV